MEFFLLKNGYNLFIYHIYYSVSTQSSIMGLKHKKVKELEQQGQLFCLLFLFTTDEYETIDFSLHLLISIQMYVTAPFVAPTLF